MIPNNAWGPRITAAAGTWFAAPASAGTFSLVPAERPLRPEGLPRSRGVAGSGFPPVSKIPHCCLPQESGPCLSASVAVCPLRPAIDRRLGRPLPHQPANRPRAPPRAPKRFPRGPLRPRAHAVLAPVSRGYPPLEGRSPTCYSPVRHCTHPRRGFLVRLACVRRAASVDSEPGSNSRRMLLSPLQATRRATAGRFCRVSPIQSSTRNPTVPYCTSDRSVNDPRRRS